MMEEREEKERVGEKKNGKDERNRKEERTITVPTYTCVGALFVSRLKRRNP